MLAEKDGTIYGLESSKIELIAHLGHKVIVRGYVLPEGTRCAEGHEFGPSFEFVNVREVFSLL